MRETREPSFPSPLIDEPDNPRDGRCCPETSRFCNAFSSGRVPPKDQMMTPLRAFMFSLTCGLALLFSVRGLVFAMQPAPDQRVGSGPIHVPTA